MDSKKRKSYDLTVDEATARDTLKDADLSSAEIVYPDKKVILKIGIDKETFELCKKIADKKQLIDYSKLIHQYIQEGIEKDKKLVS